MSDKPSVVLLSGGLTGSSRTNIAMNVVADALSEAGLDTRLVSVGEYPLPLLGVEEDRGGNADAIRGWVSEAAGLVVGSPEYHAAPSGALKNLIDYLGREEVAGKPVGLVATCGSPKGGINTLNVLRIVFRSLHAPVLVEQAIVVPTDFEGGSIVSSNALDYLRRVANGLAREIGRASHPIDNSP